MRIRVSKYVFLTVVVLFFSVTKSFAQPNFANILDEAYYGFDRVSGDDGWWMQQDNWTIATNKGANGTSRSLKYSNATVFTGNKKAFGSTTIQEMLINLEPGDYEMKAMVWVESGAQISKIKTNFRTAGEADVNVVFDLSSIAKDQWVEVTTRLNISKAFVNTNVRIFMESSYGGVGTMYFDSLQILVEEKEEIPLLSQIHTSGNQNLNLEAGNYEMSLNVWLHEDATIKTFSTSIVEPWVSKKWDLSAIEKGEWVTLKQEFSIEEAAVNSEFRIFVNNNPEYGGGKGTFYLDDISFTKTSSNAGKPDNFSILITGETCPSKGNGKIEVSAKVEENYKIEFNGAFFDFTKNKILENIEPGMYDLCISIEGEDEQWCFRLKVEEAQTLSGKVSVKGNKASVQINEGTAPFNVTVNGNLRMNTMSTNFEIDTNSGDKIEISTSNECEGKMLENVSEFELYPNPATNITTVLSGKGSSLELLNTTGWIVQKQKQIPTNYNLEVSHLKPGIYFVRLLNKDKIRIKKLIVK